MRRHRKAPAVASRNVEKAAALIEVASAIDALEQTSTRGADINLVGPVGRSRDRPDFLVAGDARGDTGPGSAAVEGSRQDRRFARTAHERERSGAGVYQVGIAAILGHAPDRGRVGQHHQWRPDPIGVEDYDPLRGSNA